MQQLCDILRITFIFMQREQRQSVILKLITGRQISRQEEIAELLEKKGFSVTQSSVSRDLLDLGIVKIRGRYALPKKTRNAVVFGLLSLDTAGENLIVAKCESGLASAVAVRIDEASISEIVGTIAGDDTIFIAVKEKGEQKIVIKKIWEIFEK
jgi:transcriptional regulator of arginine metabolism